MSSIDRHPPKIETPFEAPPLKTVTLSQVVTLSVCVSVSAIFLTLGFWNLAAPILFFGLFGALWIGSEPLTESYLTQHNWRIRCGGQSLNLPTADIRCVSIWHASHGGDKVFVEMSDGLVLPLPLETLPDREDLAMILKTQNIPLIEV